MASLHLQGDGGTDYAYRMNEPHDVPDINLWAESVQAAVTAIRQAGYAQQSHYNFIGTHCRFGP